MQEAKELACVHDVRRTKAEEWALVYESDANRYWRHNESGTLVVLRYLLACPAELDEQDSGDCYFLKERKVKAWESKINKFTVEIIDGRRLFLSLMEAFWLASQPGFTIEAHSETKQVECYRISKEDG